MFLWWLFYDDMLWIFVVYLFLVENLSIFVKNRIGFVCERKNLIKNYNFLGDWIN